MQDFIWKVGGAQGEGIDSTGELFATVLNRQGYYVFGYRHYMSLIKGGHTNYKVRVSEKPVHYHGDRLDLMIAFDQRSIDENAFEFGEDTVLVYDSGSMDGKIPEGKKVRLCPVPMSTYAKQFGNVIMKNMVACGVSAALAGLPLEPFLEVVRKKFGNKGETVVQNNSKALQKGYEFCMQQYGQLFTLPEPAHPKGHYFISGNEATALGALLAGCRFYAAYPISPSTEIMYWMLHHLPRYGGKILQAEDEIAACIMAIGANYAGCRAMTATSGPGLSLMAEAIGLSGMTETPLVIVDVMRGGPGTGLPTKTEQSDLNAMLYNSHGEMPRVVLAPASTEECFLLTGAAFRLAEQLQCPVIVASDLFLGMSKMSLTHVDFDKINPERVSMMTDEELGKLAKGQYKRYDLSFSDGISPRSVPGQKNGMHVALSNEHDENRYEIEDPFVRTSMMKKRMRKLKQVNMESLGESGLPAVSYRGAKGGNQMVIVGFGSTKAQIDEAIDLLEAEGMGFGHLHIRLLSPFPSKQVREALENAKKILVVENNATGQLAGLIRQKVGLHEKIVQFNKFDGNPFRVGEIVDACKMLKTSSPMAKSNGTATLAFQPEEVFA